MAIFQTLNIKALLIGCVAGYSMYTFHFGIHLEGVRGIGYSLHYCPGLQAEAGGKVSNLHHL